MARFTEMQFSPKFQFTAIVTSEQTTGTLVLINTCLVLVVNYLAVHILFSFAQAAWLEYSNESFSVIDFNPLQRRVKYNQWLWTVFKKYIYICKEWMISFFWLHEKFKLYPCYMSPLFLLWVLLNMLGDIAFYSSHDLLSPFASGKSESERARQDQECL